MAENAVATEPKASVPMAKVSANTKAEDLLTQFLDEMENGASCDAYWTAMENPELAKARRSDGLTALHEAVNGVQGAVPDLTLIFALVRRGADLRARDAAGRTPLHYAAEAGFPTAVAALLLAGADPNVRDAAGRTPLHAVASTVVEGDVSAGWDEGYVVRLLLEAGADPSARDNQGLSPVDCYVQATSGPYDEVVLVMLSVAIRKRAEAK